MIIKKEEKGKEEEEDTKGMDSLKRKSDFQRTDVCFICQTEKKDPKSQFRKNIPLVQIGK